jgi:hypothetical protein
MRRQAFFLVAACLVFSVQQAQIVAQTQAAPAARSGKTASGWKCAAPSPAHAVPVGDSDNHMYVVQQTPLERKADAPSVYQQIEDRFRSHGKRRPLVVHRIDQDTSGLVPFRKEWAGASAG